MNVLFVCSRNRRRSPTAERIFARYPGVETDSGGLAPDADLVVMEKRHRSALKRRFARQLGGARVVCLDIPDNYDFMQADLIALLERRIAPHLP